MQRSPEDHALIGNAAKISVPSPIPTLSYSPLTISTPGRHVDLQIKVTVPVTGTNLPVVLVSHGHGYSNNLSSMNGYGPLANFWASRGFAVIQPTHLTSKYLSLPADLSGGPFFVESRAQDMSIIIDNLDVIQKTVPTLEGRLDSSRIALAGHSLGGNTANMLLGARIVTPPDDPDNQTGKTKVINLYEPRIKVGVVFTPSGLPGPNGSYLSDFAKKFSMFRGLSFEDLTTPSLVVVGAADEGKHLNTRGPSWYADSYAHAKGPRSLFTVFGGHHSLGGIVGYDAEESARQEDEDVERASAVFRVTWAYLRSQLYPEDDAWSKACAALEEVGSIGTIESK